MRTPLVSVVVPAYNCAPYITDALKSASSQSERDLEIIVVDDGSNDSTLALAQRAAADDVRITVLTQSHSGKPAIARNRGLSLARGQFVSFLDADDLYHAEKLELQLAVFAQSMDLDVVFHDVKYIDASGGDLTGTYLERAGFPDAVLARSRPLAASTWVCNERALFAFMCTRVSTLHPSSVLVRRSRLAREEILFPEDLTVGEDIDLWFRLVASGGVGYVDRTLSSYRQHARSITKRADRNMDDAIRSHTKNYPRATTVLDRGQLAAYRKRIARDLVDTAYLYREMGQARKARALYAQSLRWRFEVRAAKALIRASVVRVKSTRGEGSA